MLAYIRPDKNKRTTETSKPAMKAATEDELMSKQEVKDYIMKQRKKGKVIWLSDVAVKLLSADLRTIVDAFAELKAEGKFTTPQN